MDQEEIITQFYSAFQNLDAEGMVNCYHQEVIFQDPAFGKLKGQDAKDMWRMLCESQKGKDFQVTFSEVTNNTAYWEAKYVFSKTGRQVHNKIDATFDFRDGLIIAHTDQFNVHRWAAQALGWQGSILGWSAYFRKKLQKQTQYLLNKYQTSSD